MCENKKGLLDSLFESREEELYVITEIDKQKIERLTKNNDSYNKLFEIIKDLSSDSKQLEKVKNSLGSYIDKVNSIGAYENEKFYKIRLFRCNKLNSRM